MISCETIADYAATFLHCFVRTPEVVSTEWIKCCVHALSFVFYVLKKILISIVNWNTAEFAHGCVFANGSRPVHI